MFTTPVKICRVWRLLSLLMLGAVMARASTIIYPVEAIDDFWQLPADEFRQKYGGINVTGIGPSDEGWYVRYKHENLTCLFGPLADSEVARKKKWELEAVRDAAIRNRASLASSKVDYVKFSYTGAFGRGGPGDGSQAGSSSARISKDGRSGPDGDLDGDGISNAKDDDMDGDGIGNGSDPDADGDGIPNEKDDYKFGGNPDGDGKGNLAKNGGQDGAGSGGAGKDGKLAGKDGASDKSGGQLGQSGADGTGSQQGSSAQKVASTKGSKAGGSAGQSSGQSGQSGQQSGQSGSQAGASGQSAGQPGGQQGQGGQPGPPGGGQGGGGNPLQLMGALLRAILGL